MELIQFSHDQMSWPLARICFCRRAGNVELACSLIKNWIGQIHQIPSAPSISAPWCEFKFKFSPNQLAGERASDRGLKTNNGSLTSRNVTRSLAHWLVLPAADGIIRHRFDRYRHYHHHHHRISSHLILARLGCERGAHLLQRPEPIGREQTDSRLTYRWAMRRNRSKVVLLESKVSRHSSGWLAGFDWCDWSRSLDLRALFPDSFHRFTGRLFNRRKERMEGRLFRSVVVVIVALLLVVGHLL